MFSSFVRKVWVSQSEALAKSMRQRTPADVELHTRMAVAKAEDGVVSRSCSGTGVFVLPQLMGESAVSRLPSSPLRDVELEAVDPTGSDSTAIGRWLFYSLLTVNGDVAN